MFLEIFGHTVQEAVGNFMKVGISADTAGMDSNCLFR